MATMCSVALPEMQRYRYADSLSAGSIAAGGTLGILIPPSVIFVLYGIMTEQSIGKLLLAGIIPGLVLTLLFMLAITLVHPIGGVDGRVSHDFVDGANFFPVVTAVGYDSIWFGVIMVVVVQIGLIAPPQRRLCQ